MRIKLLFFLFIYLCATSLLALTIRDDSSQTVYLKQPAKRLISLAPDITEIIFALHAEKSLIGVVAGSDYPEAALTLPRIGSYAGLDLERIMQLKPDLIVTWGNNFDKQIKILRKLGIPIYITNPKELNDVANTMEKLGYLLGEKDASQIAHTYRAILRSLVEKYSERKPVRVFYQIGNSLLTINKESWINQVISGCGGQNIFANVNLSVPEITLEAVVTANPHVILSTNDNAAWQAQWRKYRRIRAVRKEHLYSLQPELLERAGPRLLDGMKQVCQYLQISREKE